MTQLETDDQARLTRAVAAIEQGLEQGLRLSDVAAWAGLSEHHFHRLFRARFGIPVMDYIRRRRLTVSARRLLETSAPIIEIAFEAGFESQAAFTRAFRSVYATTPGRYRVRGRAVPWLSVDPLSGDTLATLPELKAPRHVRLEPFWVAGVEAHVAGEERAMIPSLWCKLGAAAFDGIRYCISLASADILQGVLHYMAAIEIDRAACAPEGLTVREIQAGPYLIFPFRGPIFRLAPALDYLFGAWLPSSRFSLRQAPTLERYGNLQEPGRCTADLLVPVLETP